MPSTESGLVTDARGVRRCFWSGQSEHERDYRRYHDTEWGFPVSDDRRLFEKICLEGFQSGLNWLTILRKRESFRRAFCDFDFAAVSRFNQRSVQRLLKDASIVRHRGKIESTIHNARRAVELAGQYGSLAAYFWQWEPKPSARPARITYQVLMSMPKTPESIALAADLKARGFRFVGPTTVYAFMQAVGMVNDHIEGCHARGAVERARKRFRRPG